MSNFNITSFLMTGCLSATLSLTGFGQKKGNELLDQFNAKLDQSQISFTENNGQVTDQNGHLRNDVLFGGESNGLVFHLRNNGVSYQLNRIDKWKTEKLKAINKTQKERKQIEKSTIYRVDINWLNTNGKPRVLKSKEVDGYANFYASNKQITVKSYGEVVYLNLYKGIDLKWYEKNGELKYDYLCAAGADYKKIALQVVGAESLSLNAMGELEIKTPLGTITEKSPIVLQAGKQLNSKWILENNSVSFQIENLNKDLPYIIDPAVRAWGTYYGGNSFDYANACATYTNGDVYMTGSTYLNTSTIIATSGSHQSSLGGFDDAFLVKFNSSGVRLWSTYYGGSDTDNGRSCVVDASGNVYLCGITSSTNNIATAAAHQTVIGGGNLPDGFLVKFNSSGVRQWGTYYGGNATDQFGQCAVDPSGNIYVSGTTELATSTVIATSGVHQTAFGGGVNDAFLVKFNSSGARQWGTYYGGTDVDFGNACTADANSVYLAGITSSSNSAMVSTGCHQSSYGGNLYDAYLVKFNNSNGTRTWATFYGGNAVDMAYGCATDAVGNVYMCGVSSTSVANVIATAASHQSVGATAGDDEGYLVKFNSSGVRKWGTYYGGDNADAAYGCIVGGNSYLYLVGTTSSTLSSAIATSGSHQTQIGNNTGGSNAFLAKFDTSCVRQWGTYYGEDGEDGNSCAFDVSGAIYMCGPAVTSNTSFISTTGSHQPDPGGIIDGYLVKLTDCGTQGPGNVTPPANQGICAGSSTTLSATDGTATITWYATATSTSVIGTGTNIVTTTLTAGTYTYYAEGGGCGGSPPRTGITVTVNPTPTITAGSGTICGGQSFTVQPSGASTYTVFDNSGPITGFVFSPLITTVYYVAGTNTNGCISGLFSIQAVTVTVNANPTIMVNSGTICPGQSFVIQPAGAASYTIQGGTATVSPVTATNYTVTGTSANGCGAANIATCTVFLDATPTVVVSNGSICSNSVYSVQPGGASTYTIQGGSYTVSPTSNTSYTIIGATAAGCLSQNVATCNVSVLPSPTITANNGTLCLGKSFTITPSGAATYSLIDGNGNPYTSNLVVSPLTTTSYTVSGTGANGCKTSTSGLAVVTLTVGFANITVNSGTICNGTSFTLVPAGGVTYTFQGGSNVVSPVTETNYTVIGVDNLGCTGTATAIVMVGSSPAVSVNRGELCLGSSFTISPIGFSTYTVRPSSIGMFTITGGQTVVSPTTSTEYTISGITSGICPITKTLVARVNLHTPPRMPLSTNTLMPSEFRGAAIDVSSITNSYRFTYNIDAYNPFLEPHNTPLQFSFNRGGLTLPEDARFAAQIYTLTLHSTFCNPTYTFLLTEPDVPSDQWIFPDFVSPNGDFKNDFWTPSYRGIYSSLTFFYESHEYSRYNNGRRWLESVQILFNGKIVYEAKDGVGFLFWNPLGDMTDSKTKTFAIYIVKFKGGTQKTGFITIDPTSKN